MKIANVGMQFASGPLQVISADGLPVKPFDEHRLLIGVAETYDVMLKRVLELTPGRPGK